MLVVSFAVKTCYHLKSDIVYLEVSKKYLKSYPFFNELSETDFWDYYESRGKNTLFCMFLTINDVNDFLKEFKGYFKFLPYICNVNKKSCYTCFTGSGTLINLHIFAFFFFCPPRGHKELGRIIFSWGQVMWVGDVSLLVTQSRLAGTKVKQ